MPKPKRRFWKTIRLSLLLFVLLIVAGDAWLSKIRSTDWLEPLRMVIYPINGDGSSHTQAYISALGKEAFRDIEIFMQEEAAHYQVALEQPLTIEVAPQVRELPPKPPAPRSLLGTMWWSLKMRYWAYSRDNYQGPPKDIQMFVIYFDPDKHRQLDHSLGLEKGLVGVVNAFADSGMAGQNNVVIAHEFLHTLGATDKYDLGTTLPIYPQGYAEPDLQPRFPQKLAEIMGGRIMLKPMEPRMPDSLEEVLVGGQTAREINWIKDTSA